MPTEKALPPSILIAGVDQTRKTRAVGSLRIEYQLGARGRASMEILDQDSTQTAYRPTLDQRLEVRSSDGRSLFRGTVLGVEDQPLGAPGVGTVTQLEAIDDWFGAAQRRVSRTYTAGATLKSVVSDLVTTYLTVYGITLDPTMAAGPNLPATTFDAISLEEAFNRLVDLSGWLYRLRPTGVLEWFAVGTKTRSFTLSAANKNILGPISWTKSRGQYANRIIVRYGTGLVGKQQLWHGNGTAVRFKPDYPPTWPVPGSGGQPANWIGWMTYVGGPYPGPPTPTVPPSGGGHEAIANISTGTAPWWWDATTGELVRHVGVPIPGGSAQVPAASHYFWLDYNVQYPLTVTAEAPSALTVPFEAFIERADIFDTAQAQAYANSQLAKYQVIPRTVTLKTRAADDFLPGDTVQLDVPSRTLGNALWFVTEVVLTVAVDQAPITSLTLLEGTTAQASWLDFWRDIASSGSSVGIASAGTAPPPAGQGSGTVGNYGDLTLYALIVGSGGTGIAALPSLGTLTTVLHGNPSGAPTFGPVNLSTEVIGTLPIASAPPFDALAPTSVRGDLIAHDGSDNVRFPIGTAGKVLTVDFAAPTALAWKTPAPPAPLPITTKGDLIAHDGAAAVRVPVGTPGQRLTVDIAAPTGLSWQTPIAPPVLSGALSVLGSPTNASGPATDIAAPPGSNYVLREQNGTLVFGDPPGGSGGTAGPLPDLGPTNVVDPVVLGAGTSPAVALLADGDNFRARLEGGNYRARVSVNQRWFNNQWLADAVTEPSAVLEVGTASGLKLLTSDAGANPRTAVQKFYVNIDGETHIPTNDLYITHNPRPMLQLEHAPTSAQKSRILQPGPTELDLTHNLRFDGTNWQLDDPSVGGSKLGIYQGYFNFAAATAGTNPRPAPTTFMIQPDGSFKERGRATPAGEWTDVPFNAANFTADTGSWIVTAGNISSLRYTLIGKTMWLTFQIQGTNVSGGSPVIRMVVPGFTTLAGTVYNPITAFSGTWNIGSCGNTGGGAIQVFFYPNPAKGAWPSYTNTIVSGQLIIPLA